MNNRQKSVKDYALFIYSNITVSTFNPPAYCAVCAEVDNGSKRRFIVITDDVLFCIFYNIIKPIYSGVTCPAQQSHSTFTHSHTKAHNIYSLIWIWVQVLQKASSDFWANQKYVRAVLGKKEEAVLTIRGHFSFSFCFSTRLRGNSSPVETHCGDESHRKLFHQMILQITATPADTCRPQDLQLYPLFSEPKRRTKWLPMTVTICNSYLHTKMQKLAADPHLMSKKGGFHNSCLPQNPLSWACD